MFKGRLLAIAIASRAQVPMQSVDQVEARPGKGLVGDRYAAAKGWFQEGEIRPRHEVSLIESETIQAVVRDYQLDVTHATTRRNLLTRDTPLNHLVGREFRVGNVVLFGVKLCEPCSHLESLTCEGIEGALKHRGGLRARVVSGGVLQVGDEILPVE